MEGLTLHGYIRDQLVGNLLHVPLEDAVVPAQVPAGGGGGDWDIRSGVLARQPAGRRAAGKGIAVLGQQSQDKEQAQLPQGPFPSVDLPGDGGLAHLPADTLEQFINPKRCLSVQLEAAAGAGLLQPVPHLFQPQSRLVQIQPQQLLHVLLAHLLISRLPVLEAAVLEDGQLVLDALFGQVLFLAEQLNVKDRPAKDPVHQRFHGRRLSHAQNGRPKGTQHLPQAPQRHMPTGLHPHPVQPLQGLPVLVELSFQLSPFGG